MAEQRYKTTFLFRRDTLAAWESFNPILETGEPAYAYDVNIFKIGDGIHSWKQLEPQFIAYVISADTKDEFPAQGDSAVLYKANQEKIIYQWNNETQDYEPLGLVAGLGIEIDENNKISVKISPENGLSVDEDGIKLATATIETGGAMSAEDKQKIENMSSTLKDLSAIAFSGNVNDLIQDEGDILILNCNIN